MAKSPSTLLYIRPLPLQGNQFFGSRWPDFIQLLRLHFRQSGLETPQSDSALLAFSFNHPYSAVTSLLYGLDHLRKEMGWKSTREKLPLQVLFHFHQQDDGEIPAGILSPHLWDGLAPEVLHITRPLKLQWDQLMAGRKLAAHSFEPMEHGLYRVQLPEGALIQTEKLFSSREAPLSGPFPECFYCSQTHHEPASCPSKLLPPQMQGLSLAGYLPFAQLNQLFQKAIAGSGNFLDSLLAGIKASRIRQEPLLQAFLAYYDINRVYQLRFLHQIAFSFFNSWESLGRNEALRIDNRNLHLGLDCLRVGQYSQANELFAEEGLRHRGNQFCAIVGQAFRSLEQGRDSDMESYLRKAANLAGQEKEKIYIGLLLSRFYDLQGDRWKAEHALDSILALNKSCQEALYRRGQLFARAGDGAQACSALQPLIGSRPELFMAALLDPALVPIQGLVEDLLFSHYHDLARKAAEGLGKARAECEELRSWFEGETPELQAVLATLAALEQQLERQSYFDLLDVAAKAERLFSECHQVREAKLDELKRKLDQEAARWEGFHRFWQGYPYPSFFGSFAAGIETSHGLLQEASSLLKEVRGDSYRSAAAKANDAAAALDLLQPQLARMVWVKTAIDGIRIFCRKLLVTESVLCAAGLALLLILPWFTGIPAALLTEPWFLKQLLWVLSILIAPMLALALTLWQIKE